ncbi:hypothetical protein DSM112329_02929 [Paraconexibacter sp. AEG42_29]|uniref:Uncharacterized protein n=1 Tax=Paraconexibacter sp. AEG42_29 TaxID=2997339 RepID=A0AAU7AWR8_9ACTN
MPERFDDLPILGELGQALDAAFLRAEAAPPKPGVLQRIGSWVVGLGGWRLRRLPVLVLIALGLGATAAAAALFALRATVITAPAVRDVPSAMRAVPGTGVLSAVSAPDPGGGARWTLRTTRSQTGLVCSTVGQLVDGEFGIVGLDGRFRLLPERLVDACGSPVRDRASLLSVRIFDADRHADVRSILSGVAGPALESAELRTAGGRRRLAVDTAGRFLAVLRGFPEDAAPRLTLRFAGGAVQEQQFGRLDGVVRDPLGGPALTTDLIRPSAFGTTICVRVMGVRIRPGRPLGPFACTRRTRDGALVAARQVTTGQTGSDLFLWNWGSAPSRTLIWGWLRRPARVSLLRDGRTQQVAVAADGTYIAVLPARTALGSVRIRLRPADGAPTRLLRPGAGQIPAPKLRKGAP